MKLCGAIELARMEQMQAYIGIRGAANSSQLADVPREKMDLYQKNWLRVVNDYRVPKTKWVVLRLRGAGSMGTVCRARLRA